jgi:hypothetical protein
VCVRLTTLPPSCAVVMKSGNLKFLETSGPLMPVTGPLYLYFHMYRAGLLLIIRRFYSVYTAVGLCHAEMNTPASTRQKPVPPRTWHQPVNINGMFNNFTLHENFLHFLKHFCYLILFNII